MKLAWKLINMKAAWNWIAVACIVAVCAGCWLVLLVVMPFVPDLDVRAGHNRKQQPVKLPERLCPTCANSTRNRGAYYDLIYGQVGDFRCSNCGQPFGVRFNERV